MVEGLIVNCKFVRINKSSAFVSSLFPFSAQDQADQVIYNPNEPQTVNKPELRKTIIAWLCVEYLCVVTWSSTNSIHKVHQPNPLIYRRYRHIFQQCDH